MSERFIRVRVTPRASTNEVCPLEDGTYAVRVTAAPADGEANAAVIALLAKELGLAKSRIRLKSGGTSRNKVVAIED